MDSLILDIVGWFGSLLLVIAYWSVSKKRIEADSSTFHILNIVGSILLILNTFYYGAFPSSAVNIVWVLIGLFYIFENKKKCTSSI